MRIATLEEKKRPAFFSLLAGGLTSTSEQKTIEKKKKKKKIMTTITRCANAKAKAAQGTSHQAKGKERNNKIYDAILFILSNRGVMT
jgi:hypothetical protein